MKKSFSCCVCLAMLVAAATQVGAQGTFITSRAELAGDEVLRPHRQHGDGRARRRSIHYFRHSSIAAHRHDGAQRARLLPSRCLFGNVLKINQRFRIKSFLRQKFRQSFRQRPGGSLACPGIDADQDAVALGRQNGDV